MNNEIFPDIGTIVNAAHGLTCVHDPQTARIRRMFAAAERRYDARVIAIGHSHMNCLLEAAFEAGITFEAITLKGDGEGDQASLYKSDIVLGEGATVLSDHGFPDFTDRSKALLYDSSGPILSFIGGIRHIRLGMRVMEDPSDVPFDFVLAEAPHLPLEPGTEVIPYDAVYHVISRMFKKRLTLLPRIAQSAPGRLVQFAPPPPVCDRHLQRVLAKRNAKGESPSGAKLPNRILRWKLWRLAATVLRQHAEACGARFVDCPPEALDADGFMREELVRNVSHGNVAFGRLLLQQAQALS